MLNEKKKTIRRGKKGWNVSISPFERKKRRSRVKRKKDQKEKEQQRLRRNREKKSNPVKIELIKTTSTSGRHEVIQLSKAISFCVDLSQLYALDVAI